MVSRNPEEHDYKQITSYLGKQDSLDLIALQELSTLDPFKSNLSPKKK
jgi:hypothetical protein